MPTDRELLGLAAKAAGYTLQDHLEVSGAYYPWCVEVDDCWNPLTDDDDAFRLAVELGISVWHRTTISKVYVCGPVSDKTPAFEIERLPDPYAATRRAIVRAAAEIGREMG